MDDVAKQIANLSPTKQALLKLRLKKKVVASSDKTQVSKVSTGVFRRVAGLSPVKQALLELKLKGKGAGATGKTQPRKVSTGILRQVSNLSPVKQTLLELKLKQGDTSSSNKVQPPPLSTGVLRQIATLSPVKQALLELKLKSKRPADPPSDKTQSGKVSTGILRQVAMLSPIKQALLELKLKLKQPDASPPELLKHPLPPKDIAARIAGLSPAKRALLEMKIKKGAAAALGVTAIQDSAAPVEEIKETSPARQTDSPPVDTWGEDLSEVSAASLTPTASDVEDALESPDRIAEKVEPESPEWLAGESDDDETLIMASLAATIAAGTRQSTEAPDATSVSQEDNEEMLETPAWLEDTSLEELGTPDWLLDTPATTSQEVTNQSSSASADFTEPEMPPAPDWLTDAPDESQAPAGIAPMDDATFISGPRLEQENLTASDETVSAETTPAGNAAGWLTALRAADQTIPGEIDSQTAEATGMLAGLSTLLPSEKVATSLPGGQDPDGDVVEAAQEFYSVATQAPQPATLPAPLTRREKVVGNSLRAVLLLLFVALITIPLIPATQKVVDEESDTRVPWTEPADTSGDILDSQRRQMISQQLGVIDLQQPGSVALVSFDYSTATQGEMQPLAEAVLGRLKGQGMRIIATSLEPEGAVIAQKTLEGIAASRNEAYGDTMVNLGYLPGQVAAVRRLATDPEALSTPADFKQGLNLADPNRAGWNDVKNLNQVNIVVTLADSPATARWWVEQLEAVPPPDGERFLLAATSASAGPFMQPYRDSDQLDGLISGIIGAAAIEAGRNNFGPARQMIDSLSVAHLIIVILIALGTIVAWMPSESPDSSQEAEQSLSASFENEEEEA